MPKQNLSSASGLFSEVLTPQQFIQRYYRIKDKRGKVVPLHYSRLQKHLSDSLTGNDVVVKPRQAWVSTVPLAENIEFLRRNPGNTAYIITHKDEATYEFRDRSVFMADSVPPPFHIPIVKDREGLFVLANDSRLHIQTAGGKMVALATSVQRVHVTEMWAMELDAEEIILQAFEAVPEGGRKIIESTPGRLSGLLNNSYSKAKEGGGRKAHFYAWWWVDEYRLPRKHPEFPRLMTAPMTEHELMLISAHNLTDEQVAWRRAKAEELGEEYFQMIYPEDDISCWMTSEGGFFDNALLSALVRKGLPAPIMEYDA